MPVQLRIVEEKLYALPPAFGRQLPHRVSLERSPIDDVVGRGLRREHREAVVVARRDRDVPDTSGPGDRYPFMGVELDRIEFRRQPLVRRRRNRLVLHHPFAGAELGIDAPMNQHPKAGVTEPFARGQSLGGKKFIDVEGERNY